jgi:ADP-ribosylglycohydrolase
MRVAPLGAYFADDVELAASQAGDSAKVTHAHPDGVAGAIAVAVAAAHACRLREREDTSAAHPALLDVALQHCPSGPTRDVLLIARQLPATTTTAKAARALGNGSRLLSCDTVPFALWCAQTYLHDYAEALWQTVSALGDRDTTCAIVGGVVGLVDPPPRKWLHARENLRFESLSDGSEPLQRIARRLEIWLRSIRSTRPNRP